MGNKRHGLRERDPYEQRVLIGYADNLRQEANALGVSRSDLRGALARVLEESSAEDELDQLILDHQSEDDDPPLSELLQTLRSVAATIERAGRPAPSPMQRHIDALSRFFALDANTSALFGLIIRLLLTEGAMSMWKACNSYSEPSVKGTDLHWMAAVAGVPRSCAEALTPSGVLVTSGLCTLGFNGDIEIPNALRQLIQTHQAPPADLTEVLIGRVRAPRLDWDDFAYLGQSRDLISRILARRGSPAECGVHVLLHGAPGTGKTEFAATLARHIRSPLVALGECGNDGDELNRQERLATLRRAASVLTRRQRRVVLLVDEAEDVLETHVLSEILGARSSRLSGSKVYLHRLMETFPVPVIWIVNDLWRISDTVIRRMMYVQDFRDPTPATRKAIWGRALKSWDVPATEQDVERLSVDLAVPPAVVSTATRTATLINGGLPEVRQIAMSLAKALNGGMEVQPPVSGHNRYCSELANTDPSATAVLERIARSAAQDRAFSLCLHGPPGTGKSAYARHLAGLMGLEVVQKRASDLISKWVGDTEKRIAMAFRDARNQGAMLIFDEADSFLRSRELSQAGWEVSQVNEMLTWMESHPLPFVCTTNLMDALDPASLRRFTFKLKFDYLGREQARMAFLHFFGREAPEGLDLIELLTPSDFALALKRAGLGDFLEDDEAILDLLRAECALKPGSRRAIGFQ
ncbi:MAG: AAA family ATPase [Pseudomonadota bacterium]|nr:AAA family ATPase [Pseudomonadota bacterium]